MTRRFVPLLFALAPVVIGYSGQSQARNTQPLYAPVTLCEISSHHKGVSPKYISVDAEYINAVPHGLFLTDRRCPRKVLQIDFADNGLDPSVALIKDHLLQIHRADGTFRGIIKRDSANGRLFLWLQSVINFQSPDYQPEPKPIRLPEPPFPNVPPE
jgi:hypothetical protein